MKSNKLTPGGNLVWEGSRMILPEHKERLIEYRKNERNIKERPILDEQRLHDISYIIAQSMADREQVTFVLFGEIVDQEITGVVEKVDQQMRRVKVRINEEDWQWVKLNEIINIHC